MGNAKVRCVVVPFFLVSSCISFGALAAEVSSSSSSSTPFLSPLPAGQLAPLHKTGSTAQLGSSAGPAVASLRNDSARYDTVSNAKYDVTESTGRIKITKLPLGREWGGGGGESAKQNTTTTHKPSVHDSVERKQAFEALARFLNSKKAQTRRGFSRFPRLSRGNAQQPLLRSGKKKDEVQRFSFFPLSPPEKLGRGARTFAKSERTGPPAKRTVAETQKHEQDRRCVAPKVSLVPTPKPAKSGAAASSVFGGEQKKSEEKRSVTMRQDPPIISLPALPKTATPRQSGKRLTDAAARQKEIQEEREKEDNNNTGASETRRRPPDTAQTQEAREDTNKAAEQHRNDEEKETIVAVGRHRNEGATGKNNELMGEPAKTQTGSKIGVSLPPERMTASPDSRTKKQEGEGEVGGVLLRQSHEEGKKYGDDVGPNIGKKRTEEKTQRVWVEGTERSGLPAHTITHSQQVKTERKIRDRYIGKAVAGLPLHKNASPTPKRHPAWSVNPRPSILGDALDPSRRRSQIIRQRAAQVREAQKWKDGSRSRGGCKGGCGNNRNNLSRNSINHYTDMQGYDDGEDDSSESDGYTKAWTHPRFPRPLPRTSYTTVSGSINVEPSVHDLPNDNNLLGSEATHITQQQEQQQPQQQQLSRGNNDLSAGLYSGNAPPPQAPPPHSFRTVAGDNEFARTVDALDAALFNGNLPYPLHSGQNNEDPRSVNARLQLSALAPLDVWKLQNMPEKNLLLYQYTDQKNAPEIDFTKFPFSRGPLSIPSSTSTTSGGFGGVGKSIRPLPPMLLDSSETLARYAEPGEEDTDRYVAGGTKTDSEFWRTQNSNTFPLLNTHPGDGGARLPTDTYISEKVGTTTIQDVKDDTTKETKDVISRKRHQYATTTADVQGKTRNIERKQHHHETTHARKTVRSGIYTRTDNRSRVTKHTQQAQQGGTIKDNYTRLKDGRGGIKKTRLTQHKSIASVSGGHDHHHHHHRRHRHHGENTAAAPVGGKGGRTEGKQKENHSRVHYDTRAAERTSVVPRIGKARTLTRSKGKSVRKSVGYHHKRVPIVLPAKEELVVDKKARQQLGRRADRLKKKPLIERTSSGCLNVISEILTPGTPIIFEPRPDVTEEERFTPMSLVWGSPLGAGANGIVYEVSVRNKGGKRVRYAMKMSLNRHQSVCNAWTRDKRGELTPAESIKFADDVKRVCFAEYEAEMRQRRLLSLPPPSPATVTAKNDVGKLFAERQVCLPLAIGRIRGLPDYMVCPGGNVAVVNVVGLTPAASCNLYQILAAYDLTVGEKYELTRQVIRAVSSIHSLGLLHKDLKSENLVVTSRGDVIVADLAGAEPLVRDGSRGREQFDPGTVTFVAPERAAARLGRAGASSAITVKANAWSLGMMIYEIWCRGADPFHLETLTDEEVLARLDNMLRRYYPVTFSSCPPVPRTAQKIITSLLQPDPRRRKTPASLMWTLPLLRKQAFLGRSMPQPYGSRRDHNSHRKR